MAISHRKRLVVAGALLFVPGVLFLVYGLQAKRFYQPHIEHPLASYSVEPYAAVLKSTVADGWVDYRKIAYEHANELDRFIEVASRCGPKSAPAQFPTAAHRLAFYLNAYNACMLMQIVRKRIPKIVPRYVFLYTKWRIDGSWISLDALEQKLIRVEFDEPRIHFALVCAARDCPPLRAEPYVAARLDRQLEDQGRAFIREEKAVHIAEGRVVLAAIFKWYRSDFRRLGGLKSVLLRYLPPEDPRRAVVARTAPDEFHFRAYDWTVNDKANRTLPTGVRAKR